MKETLKLALILFIITAVSAGILAVVNNSTSVIIAERQAEELAEALKVVSPEASEFEPADEATLASIQENYPMVKNLYSATDGGELKGYVFDLVGKGGYGGDILFILGINHETLEITGLQVLEHGETPGFGAAAEEPWFSEGAIGATEAEGIEVIAGATKTTDAIKGAIAQAYGAMDSITDGSARLPIELMTAFVIGQ